MRQKLLLLVMAIICASCCFGQISAAIPQYKRPNISPGTTASFSTIFSKTSPKAASTGGKAKTTPTPYMKDVSSRIDSLRDRLDTATGSATIQALEDDVKTLRLAVTARFLSSTGKNHPFWIGDIKNYDIDTLNNYFYNQDNVSAFQSVSIQHAVDAATFVNAEFASFLFGPLRMGVGGSFKTSGDTTKDNAVKSSLQKILYTGGAINLNFSLPIFFTRSRRDQVHFGIFGQINNGINPGINDSTGNTSFSNDVAYINQSGINFHFDAGSNDQKAKISFDIPVYYAWGSNNAYDLYDIRDYSVIKLKVGVVIKNLLDLQLVGPLWSSSRAVKNLPFNIALQFSPTQMLGR